MLKFILYFSLICGSAFAHDNITMTEVPAELRDYYQNWGGGSCVYMSIGINGLHRNNINAASCHWNSPYGKENVGGASPSDVARMAKERNLALYNVTANDYETMRKWFIWATQTNRFCALGFGGSHYQTLYGHDPKTNTWYIVDNNSPKVIRQYTEQEFRRLHEASGYWAVFLIGPAAPASPKYEKWWK